MLPHCKNQTDAIPPGYRRNIPARFQGFGTTNPLGTVAGTPNRPSMAAWSVRLSRNITMAETYAGVNGASGTLTAAAMAATSSMMRQSGLANSGNRTSVRS